MDSRININAVAGMPGAAGRPVIGISAHAAPVTWAFWDMRPTHLRATRATEIHATLVPQRVVDRVAAAGCMPVLLPPLPGIEDAVGRLDGLLLPSGPDVDPALYAAALHPKTGRLSPGRDAAELALLGAALGAGLPVLGICRGLHVLNVLRSGTLHQHLPEITGHNGHAPGPAIYAPQQLRLAPGSRVAGILGGDTALVRCSHHQAVDQLGTGLTATAWSHDGTVEAVELADHPFAIAVQWHAEEGEEERLFLALAEAARQAQHRVASS